VSRRRAIAVVFVACLAVVAGDPGRHPGTGTGASEPSAGVTATASGLGDLLVPTRPSLATAGWADPASAKSRAFPQPAVVAAMAGLLVVLVAGLARHRPGPPWHLRRRHSAVLRAPPLLLHP